MDWGRLRFFLGEVVSNFTRNAVMQLTAIGTVTVTVLLLGTFMYAHQTLTQLGSGVLSKIEISAYLKDDVDDVKARSLSQKLAADARVASADYIPRAQGLKEMVDRLQGQIDMSLLTTNPLPNAFRVRVKNPDDVNAVASTIEKYPEVAQVDYAADVVRKLLRATDVFGRVGIAMIGLLLITAAIIIANTIRLTVFARRREISIMQLVGATNMYIRGPFICEGLLAGFIGSLVAVAILAVARFELAPRLFESLAFIAIGAVKIDEPLLAGELLLTGAAVGFVAAWLSVGRYLRT
ncbi:MAG TPA: permease-like cell division protein FtsX [Candidatus Binatia bacterium]|nr:permease-like cell division protein FtsX [Candidatus Binatia bacterium]